MGKDQEVNPLIAEYQKMVSDEAIGKTLENLKFPELKSTEDIKIFFLALLRKDSDYNTRCLKLAEVIHKTPLQTREVLETIRAARAARGWKVKDADIFEDNSPHTFR